MKNLKILHHEQEYHQRITTTIVGKIEAENPQLISNSRGLLDSQKCRLLQDGFEDGDSQAHTLVAI